MKNKQSQKIPVKPFEQEQHHDIVVANLGGY